MPGVDPRLDQLRVTGRGRFYVGAGRHGLGLADPEHALLVVGPPRSGKTTSLVIPNVLAAPGPVVSTSTKTDVLAATVGVRRALGHCWLFDPTGAVAPPAGVDRVRWSPVVACRRWDDALATARAMATTARPGGRWGESSHWTERAEALLAPLLHAAANAGGDMRTVVEWILRGDSDSPRHLLAARGATLAGAVLAGIAATDSREQSGIWSTAAGVVAAYRSEAALDAGAEPNFDPARLATGNDTVYICAPARDQGLVAPIIVAFLESVRAGAYAAARAEQETGGAGRTPLVLALDEVANIAPLPDLPAMVSEGAGQGLLTLACLQDLSQARLRWGPAADGFLTLFGTKVVLPGIADLATLELVSRLGGDVDVPARSVSRGPWWSGSRSTPTTTWSPQRQRRLPVDAINQQPGGTALVLSGHRPPTRVRLSPWWNTPPFAPAAASTAIAAGPVAPSPRPPGRNPQPRARTPGRPL